MQGAVAAIAQNNVTVTTKTGPSKVDILPTTKVLQDTPGQLSDITSGSCVAIKRAAAAPGGPPGPAANVTISAAPTNGKCWQSSDPKASSGAVTAVNGQTVLVADTTGAPTAIPVNDKTRYVKRATTTALAITQGSCMIASGTQVNADVLQAISVTVSAAPVAGVCPGVK
ncbi:hypothetical protein [Mycolicibacterium vinylchloridicum]|uniref:hypothetical protein n=1 Tax=Mycolicibacterium vinylchloridicum TaxID=2736928 RepID=UPI0015C6AFBA|nr:hypothetical protein [Mycolicibacterium vinylchloridicum]